MVWSAWATTAAAAIALVAVVVNIFQRRADRNVDRARERKRSEAQARLIYLTCNVDLTAHEVLHDRFVRFSVTNYSDRAILDLVAEVWIAGQDLNVPTGRVSGPITLPIHTSVKKEDGDGLLTIVLANYGGVVPKLIAWRVRWTDADGQAWCRDRSPQDPPDRFIGQSPTPY